METNAASSTQDGCEAPSAPLPGSQEYCAQRHTLVGIPATWLMYLAIQVEGCVLSQLPGWQTSRSFYVEPRVPEPGSEGWHHRNEIL